MNSKQITTKSSVYPQAAALLESYDLNTSDITDARVALWSLEHHDELVGVIGAETSGDIGLLRSLAVARRHQGKGAAQKLCESVFKHFEEAGVTDVYLLTETASEFFSALGFASIDRDQAPEALKQTTQFSSLCPASATVMVRTR